MSAQAATADRAVFGRDRREATFKGAWLLSGAMVLSGVLTYAYHVLAARELDGAAYGQIAILWGGIFVAAIVLFRPLEQTMARAVADRLARGEEVRTVLRSVVAVALGLTAAITLGAALAWRPMTDALFAGDDVMTALLYAGAVGYGISYLARGLVGGVRWFNGYGLLLTADSIVRLAVAAPIVVFASKHTAAFALVAAAIGGAVAPLIRGRAQLRPLLAPGKSGTTFHAAAALRFAAPAGAVAGADQLLVNGAPIVVILGGGASAKTAGTVFAATMLVRAPVYVFQGMAASLLPNFTLLRSGDKRSFYRVIWRTVRLLALVGAVIVASVALVGPLAMRTLYGADFAAGRGSLVLLAVGVSLYLASATFLQVLLAVDRGGRAALAWSLAAVVFIAGYLALSGDELWRVSLAFFAAMLTCLLLHAALLRRPHR